MSGLELILLIKNDEIEEGSIITSKSNYCGFEFVIHYEYRKVSDDLFDFIDIENDDNVLEANDLIYCNFEVMSREDFKREWRIDL